MNTLPFWLSLLPMALFYLAIATMALFGLRARSGHHHPHHKPHTLG